MQRINFIISNPRHHFEISQNIINSGKSNKINVEFRIISLCAIRGLISPIETDLKVIKLSVFEWFLKFRRKSRPVRPKVNPSLRENSVLVKRIRKLIGIILLKYTKFLINKKEKIILFNDAAYPFEIISNGLINSGRQVYLIQEGIRYPLPVEEDRGSFYGGSRVDKIFIWGDVFLDYFKSVKNDTTDIVVSGSPRHWSIRDSYISESSQKLIGIFTNSIDHQGFVTEKQKLALYGQLFKACSTLKDYKFYVRLHPGEDEKSIKELFRDYKNIWFFEAGASLEECLSEVSKGIVFTSTVGIELALRRKPVGFVWFSPKFQLFDEIEGFRRLDLNSPDLENFIKSDITSEDLIQGLNTIFQMSQDPSELILSNLVGIS